MKDQGPGELKAHQGLIWNGGCLKCACENCRCCSNSCANRAGWGWVLIIAFKATVSAISVLRKLSAEADASSGLVMMPIPFGTRVEEQRLHSSDLALGIRTPSPSSWVGLPWLIGKPVLLELGRVTLMPSRVFWSKECMRDVLLRPSGVTLAGYPVPFRCNDQVPLWERLKWTPSLLRCPTLRWHVRREPLQFCSRCRDRGRHCARRH